MGKWWDADPNPASYLAALAVGIVSGIAATAWMAWVVGGTRGITALAVTAAGATLAVVAGRSFGPRSASVIAAVGAATGSFLATSVSGEFSLGERVGLSVAAGAFFSLSAALISWRLQSVVSEVGNQR